MPDKGFGFRARSFSSPLSAALGSRPFLCLPSGSVSSRDPLLDLEVLLCRAQACLLNPATSGGCPPSRLGSGSSSQADAHLQEAVTLSGHMAIALLVLGGPGSLKSTEL